MLVVFAALVVLSMRVTRASPPPAERRVLADDVGWSFQFVVRQLGGNGSVVVGSEYYAVSEQRVRRDWSQGVAVLPDCPLPAEAGGSELVNVAPGDASTQHVLYLAAGMVRGRKGEVAII
jgi:hypothetical protein